MVLQKALDNLKDKPKDEKVVVAGGIAVSVVIVLLVAWSIYFFHKIQQGTQTTSLESGAQDEFNFTSVREAQQQLQQQYASSTDDLQDIRDRSATGDTQMQQTVPQQTGDGGTDQFGTPSSSN